MKPAHVSAIRQPETFPPTAYNLETRICHNIRILLCLEKKKESNSAKVSHLWSTFTEEKDHLLHFILLYCT